MRNDQEISEKTHTYLRLLGPSFNRQFVFGIVVIQLGLFGMLPLLAVPFSNEYFYAAVVPAFLVLIWGILQFIAPYRLEKLHHLYVGVSGFALTYIYFLVTQKLIYLHIGATHIGYFIAGLVLFVLLLVAMWKTNIRYLFEGSYYDPNKRHLWGGSNQLIVKASGVGYVLGQVLLSIVAGDSITMIIIILCLSLFAIFTAFMGTFVHRYWYIHQNIEAVRSLNPGYSLPNKDRAPGPTHGYAVLVLTEKDYDTDEVDEHINDIIDNVEDVEIDTITFACLPEMDKEERKPLEEALPNQVLQAPGYVLFQFEYEEMKAAVKKMEKKHHNGFFKKIPSEKYAFTQDQVALQPKNAILYTNDLRNLDQGTLGTGTSSR
ncbi:hypothetical protein [Halobacillus salinus]|uniref:Uncharacterized protein n=1 Tax=Halobacillus salinus TaxID=192814 RepID=A0A4Z0H0F7_9BACI|nr:hypothetical protein [Halobacillus salinus]TGB03469.1 hypothetical protein E4663_00230 [Halobacillus salinus]